MNVSDNATSGDRSQLVSAALLEIAAGDDTGAIEATGALIRWSMRLLDIAGAGVMMADDRGVLRPVMVSSDAVRALEVDELDQGRGPCVESHRTASAVIHADIDVVDARWPQFGPSAQAGGMRAAHAIPIMQGGTAIGVLNLFRATPGGLADADTQVARALAGAVGAPTHHAHPQIEPEQMSAGFADAAVVEHATGMLAVRLRVDIDTASAVLRHVARDRTRTVAALAADVVAGTTHITLPLFVTPPPSDPPVTD